jgi:hypothetical protein
MAAGFAKYPLTPDNYVGINNTKKVGKGMAKRAGRPEVAASQRRDVIFRFVVTKAEASKIRAKAKAEGQTISEYLRGVAIPKE